jgi:hypothetical protein
LYLVVAGSTPAFFAQTMGVKGVVREAARPREPNTPANTGSGNSLINPHNSARLAPRADLFAHLPCVD